MKKFILALIVALIAFISSLNAQNNITVKVSNLNDSEGTLKIALFDSKETFLSPTIKRAQSVSVQGTTAEIIFKNLPDGEYAITLYQDSNNNKIFDLGEYKIPIEKYGFSNNIDPATTKGVPNFDECKIDVKEDTYTEIKAVYAIK